MLKLLKWTVYGLIGYAVYEFVSGMAESRPSAPAPTRMRRPQSAPRRRRRASSVMTGPGKGAMVPIADSTGATRREKVGRGVVH